MTDTTVIQPGAGQAILTTDHRDHGHHGHHGDHHNHRGFDAVEARADFRSLTNEVERFGTANLGSAARTNEIVQAGNCRTDSLVQAGFGDTSDRICAGVKDVTGAVGTGFTAQALAACKIDDAIGDSKLFSAVQFKDQVIEANKNAANLSTLVQTVGNAAQVLASSIGNAASVQATSNYNGLTVAATNNFNQTTVQVERVRAELESKMAAAAAAAVLLATQLDAQARREAEACCCKLTALIIAQGEATRAQGADFRMRDLEGRLNRIPVGIAVTIPPGL
jgi:hypothetical protein